MQVRNRINHAAYSAAGALTMIVVATTLPIAAAQAQQNNSSMTRHQASITEITGTASSNVLASTSVPGSVEPIMRRAATLMSAAQTRARVAPEGARQSYQSAITAFQQLMAAGRMSAGSGYNVGNATNIPVSSTQVADDIRLLRAAAMGANGSQASVLNRMAGLYATGAKEFFTGELRDALLGEPQAGPAVAGRGVVTRSARRGSTNAQGGVIQPDGTVAAGSTGSGQNPVTANGSGFDPVVAPVGGVTPPVGGVVVPAVPGDPTAPVIVPPVVTTPPVVVVPPANPAPPPATNP